MKKYTKDIHNKRKGRHSHKDRFKNKDDRMRNW